LKPAGERRAMTCLIWRRWHPSAYDDHESSLPSLSASKARSTGLKSRHCKMAQNRKCWLKAPLTTTLSRYRRARCIMPACRWTVRRSAWLASAGSGLRNAAMKRRRTAGVGHGQGLLRPHGRALRSRGSGWGTSGISQGGPLCLSLTISSRSASVRSRVDEASCRFRRCAAQSMRFMAELFAMPARTDAK